MGSPVAEDIGENNGSAGPERFAVSIAVHENAVVARASGELDYQFAHLPHQQVDGFLGCQAFSLVSCLKVVQARKASGLLVFGAQVDGREVADPAVAGDSRSSPEDVFLI
jgi:hypothetical protein